MAKVKNLHQEHPSVVCLQLSLLSPETLTAVGKDVARALEEACNFQPREHTTIPEITRLTNEINQLRSLHEVLAEHSRLFHRESVA